MKYCPDCQDFALYDDDQMNCPLCQSVLRPYIFEEEEIQYQDIVQEPLVGNETVNEFMQNHTFYNQYHGSIVHVEHYHRVYPFFYKIVRALFLNEPFQFGYLTYYTNIIIEENRYDSLPEQQVSLTYCGDIAGSVMVGEEVDIRTKPIRRSRIASIVNSQTGAKVRKTFSLPGWLLWGVIACLPVGLSLAVSLVVAFISAILPTLLTIFVFYALFKTFF